MRLPANKKSGTHSKVNESGALPIFWAIMDNDVKFPSKMSAAATASTIEKAIGTVNIIMMIKVTNSTTVLIMFNP